MHIEPTSDPTPVRELGERLRAHIGRVLVGKEDVIDLALVALLCEGHVLLEDVPGLGKTMLAKTIARSLGCTFRRIQCTPDLLPADITGLSFFNQRTQSFEFRPGPVFAQVVLADEINRATPRTQAALLECMEERQVTAEGETRLLPRPFLVIATQNPIELRRHLPPARGAARPLHARAWRLGYPSLEEERAIVRRFRADNPLEELRAVAGGDELLAAGRLCRQVHVSTAVEDYILALVRGSRGHAGLELGASPRASLALYRGAQALAALRGRDYVLPDDVKALAVPVLAHRLIASSQARLRGTAAVDVVAELLAATPVPVEDDQRAAPAGS